MKNSLLIFIIFIVSCSNKKVLLDEYYYQIQNIQHNSIKSTPLIDLNVESYFKYKKILVSPMIYKLYEDKWSKYKGKLYVLEGRSISSSIINIEISDSLAYKNLYDYLDKNQVSYNKISVIIDYNSKTTFNEYEKLKKIDETFNTEYLLLDGTVDKNLISDFIKSNRNSDLWIINSLKFGLFSYDLIKGGDILIKNGSGLTKLNSEIKYSIDLDINPYIDDIFNDKTTIIYTNFKKY